MILINVAINSLSLPPRHGIESEGRKREAREYIFFFTARNTVCNGLSRCGYFYFYFNIKIFHLELEGKLIKKSRRCTYSHTRTVYAHINACVAIRRCLKGFMWESINYTTYVLRRTGGVVQLVTPTPLLAMRLYIRQACIYGTYQKSLIFGLRRASQSSNVAQLCVFCFCFFIVASRFVLLYGK